jgi:hypothetical protein
VVDLASAVSGRGTLESMNPITTAGSMQVSVRFALEASKGEGLDEFEVRDRLYTRAGGIHYGALRLLGYPADYEEPLYRFADYNAGQYTSRNAALQEQVAELTGHKLTPDGDLLAYDKRGKVLAQETNTFRALLAFGLQHAPQLPPGDLRRDAEKEKERALEETRLWRAVKSTYEERLEKKPAYARLPQVAILSPKMKQERSTAWFAQSVDRRYRACLARGISRGLGP